MRALSRLLAIAGLVVAGGLALPAAAAQASACSGTTGVTVVIDFGSSASTRCAPGDPSSAMSALKAVAVVVSPAMYPGTVVCRIDGTPSSDPCQRMPPASAYWAFFHAQRGGSWVYSSAGVAEYDPAPGTVVGFAFGSGSAPSTAPPAAAPRPSPKPSPTPTPSSSSTTPWTPRPASTTPARPGSSAGSSARSTTSTARTGTATATTGARTATIPTMTAAPTSTTTAPSTPSTGTGDSAAGATTPESGSATTLLAGLGLVGLVGGGAAYLAVRRRAHG